MIRPMPGSTVLILDPEGHELPPGEVGEIFQDLASLVNDQGAMVDDVEANVGAVAARAGAAARAAAAASDWPAAAAGVVVVVAVARARATDVDRDRGRADRGAIARGGGRSGPSRSACLSIRVFGAPGSACYTRRDSLSGGVSVFFCVCAIGLLV